MKILVCTETYLPTINGVVNSIELFRHQLEKNGHQVDIVAPHSAAESFKSRSHVFRLPSLPLIGQPTHPVAWPSKSHISAIISETKPDVVHCQGMFACGWLGLKGAQKANLPHVLTYHTHLEGYSHYAGPLSFLAKPIMRWWTKKMCNQFDLVITPSPSMAKMLKSYKVKTDIVALPTGIELKDYRFNDKKKLRAMLKFNPDEVYILSAGRLSEEKNVKQLLIDFGRIHVRNPKVKLLLAGDGPERKAYETIVEARGLQSVVTFLGALKHEDLINYFVACDIFAFPSLTDTQGIVLIEAMAAGCPSVVYDMLGPGDIVKHEVNGLKAKVGTDQFFQHLFALVSDQDLREKISIGGLRDVRNYSIEKTADQLQQIYAVLCKRP
ncbi:MAG: glycosyltransferase [Patescibacteria group bacterium]|jgi:glycosyltransferase involved in cell wall biosynthesis